MWKILRRRRRGPRARSRTKSERAHYALHKESARTIVHERLEYWTAHYGVTYGKVFIRDQRSRWGSCSSKGNLNFNYRIVFLPPELVDYIVVHELCHRIEFNHSVAFWDQVARTHPNHAILRRALRSLSPSLVAGKVESPPV